MAIDTENKRRSVHGYSGSPIYPVADGTIGSTDRPHVAWLYAGAVTALTTCDPEYAAPGRNLDVSMEHLVWDNVQTITHISVRNTGDVESCVEYAHRHNIGRRELAASNGVYTPDDVIWRFPSSYVTGRVKPRDRLVDSEAVEWTILEVGRNRDTYDYRCVCRDLIIAADLDDLIDVQRATITYGDAGEKIYTWATVYDDIPARLQPVTGEIVEERGIRGLNVSHTCIVDRQLSVTHEDRVVLGGVIYEIRGFANPERIDELMTLDLDRVP